MGPRGSQIAAPIKRSGRPVHIDDFGEGTGPIRDGVRKTGIRGGQRGKKWEPSVGGRLGRIDPGR
jgi:hypothetical protein